CSAKDGGLPDSCLCPQGNGCDGAGHTSRVAPVRSVEQLVAVGLRAAPTHPGTATSGIAISRARAPTRATLLSRIQTARDRAGAMRDVPSASVSTAPLVGTAVVAAAITAACGLLLHDSHVELRSWLTPESGGLSLTARF